MTFLKTIAVSATIPLLVACGGAGAGLQFAPVGSGPITVEEIDNISNQLELLGDRLTATDVTLTRPAVANATYNGYAGFDLGFTRSVTGRISMNADFTSNTVTGSAGDFSTFDDTGLTSAPLENLSGTLAISNGTIAGTSMSGDLTGTLTAAAGDYGVTSTMDGAFIDISGQSVVGGALSGSFTHPDTSSSSIDGAFIAVSQ